MTIKSQLAALDDANRKRLLAAFNDGFSQIVILDDQSFVGVNCGHITNLVIVEEKGAWAAGTIK